MHCQTVFQTLCISACIIGNYIILVIQLSIIVLLRCRYSIYAIEVILLLLLLVSYPRELA